MYLPYQKIYQNASKRFQNRESDTDSKDDDDFIDNKMDDENENVKEIESENKEKIDEDI